METVKFRLKPATKNKGKEFAPIDWTDVVAMRNLYLAHPAAPKVPTTAGDETLKGLNITKTDVLNIFNADAAIDEILILFAVRKEDKDAVEAGTIQPDEYDKQYFTTVLVGMKNGTAITATAKDYCEPCPSKCGNIS